MIGVRSGRTKNQYRLYKITSGWLNSTTKENNTFAII